MKFTIEIELPDMDGVDPIEEFATAHGWKLRNNGKTAKDIVQERIQSWFEDKLKQCYILNRRNKAEKDYSKSLKRGDTI